MRKYTILYAEDESEIRKVYAKVLKDYFDVVLEASNGKEALEIYQKEKPEVLLLDVDMPILDGLSLAKTIRSNDKNCKIIILSAYSDKDKLLEACELNLIKYLVKPIKTLELIEVLNSAHNELTQEYKDENIKVISKDMTFNEVTGVIVDKGNDIKLSKNEIKLFHLLVKYPGALITIEEITNYLWNDSLVNDNKVRVLIYRINKKISRDIITSVYGVGYKLIFI